MSFVSKYKAVYGSVPDQFAADGYDAIYAIKAAVEKAGYKKASDVKGSGLSAALVQLTLTGVTGEMKWQANGNTDKAAMAIIYQNGVGKVFGE
jgi:branched-chain amino acid transport system substrate-binding protein